MKQTLQNQRPARNQKPFHAPATETSLDRHRRKCAVCHHPEREAIEEEFLHWHNPVNIVHEFDLGDRRILYRHAHATGLYDQRRRNYLFTIENVLECGEDIDFTAAAYIKAVRAYACLCDTVRWSEPVTRVLHEYNVHSIPSAEDAPADCARGTDSLPPERSRMGQPVQDTPACSAESFSRVTAHEPRATGPEPHPAPAKNQQAVASRSAGSVSSANSDEKFLAAAIPLLGATPQTVAELKKSGLTKLASLAARHLRAPRTAGQPAPPSSPCPEPGGAGDVLSLQTPNLEPLTSSSSNRHNLELESPVTPTKQTSEVVSNRHKITK